MNIEDINKECKKLAEKQSYIKKALVEFFEKLNKDLKVCNADVSLHIRLPVYIWERHINFQFDIDGEFANHYYLVLENNKIKLQLDDTEYYNQTGSSVYENVSLEDVTPTKARNILLELPEAFSTLLEKLTKINEKYDKAISSVNEI